MNNYVIRGNWMTGRYGNLFKIQDENIQGKNPLDAVEKRFKRKFRRVSEDSGEEADLYVLQAVYDKKRNTVKLWGDGSEYCYDLIPD